MALKNNWNDLVDGESFVEVEPINRMAHAIIANEENILSVQKLSESIQAENKSQEAEINELSKDLTRFEGDAVRLDSKISENKKRITNLERGIPSDLFLTDSSIAYSKDVPQNALPYAEVRKIGGATRKCTNLIPSAYRFWASAEVNGITYTANSDGSITLNGTATKTSVIVVSSSIKVKDGTHTVGKISPDTGVFAQLFYKASDGSYPTWNVYNDPVTLDMSAGTTYSFQLAVNAGAAVSNVKVYPMLNEGSTALPYEPYFEGLRSAPVTEAESVGVNLFDPAPIGTKTFIGLTYTTEDGYVKINGTKVNGANIHPMTEPEITLPAGTYTVSVRMISGTVSGMEGTGGVFFGINKNSYSQRTTPGVSKVGDVGARTFTLSEPTLITSFDIAPDYGSVGAVFSNAVFACQFEQAATATDFKPYTRNTLPIPEAVQALDGYGEGNPDNAEEYNAIIWENGKRKYIHKGDITDNVWEPLATPEVIDISDLVSEDNFIGVEGNGTITMINQYKYNVPSEIVFMLNEV